ncbi:hypothetical protein Tco_0369389 [Tanacetum coccineum]
MKAPHVFTTIGRTKFPPIPLYKSTEIQSKEAFADFDGNTQFVPYDSLNHEEIESSTTNLEPSNVQNFHQVQPLTHIWTKDHPLDQVIGDPSKPVMTRQWLHTDSELNQFERLQVWELVPRPGGKNVIALKWLWKNKCDAENTGVRNKSSSCGKSTPMATERLDADLQGTPTDQTTYHRMIGGLMYLTASRPDIAFATFVCARYQARPTVKHLKEVKRIFRYLRQSYNMGLWYPKDSSFELIAYSDADHAGCKDDCKSHPRREAEYFSIVSACCLNDMDAYSTLDYGFRIQSDSDLSSWHRRTTNKQLMLHKMKWCPTKQSDMTSMKSHKMVDLENFWHTLREDGSKYRLKFMLDRKELTFTLDDFRTIFHLSQANDNNHASFVPPPSFSDMVPFYKQVLGFSMELKTGSNFKIPEETKQGSDANTTMDDYIRRMKTYGANIRLSLAEQKSHEEQEARENVALVAQHLAAEEIEKLVEESENVDDSSPTRHDDTSIPDTRIEPRSDKESPKVEIDQEKEEETTKDMEVEPNIVIPVNVDDEEDEITDEVFELRRRAKGKNVEEQNQIDSKDIRLSFMNYKGDMVLIASSQEKVQPRTSSDQLADNLHDVMMENATAHMEKEKKTYSFMFIRHKLSMSSSVPEQHHYLYLAMKVPHTACRPSAVRPRDQDDPHDDAHPEGENNEEIPLQSDIVFGSRNGNSRSPHPRKITPLVSKLSKRFLNIQHNLRSIRSFVLEEREETEGIVARRANDCIVFNRSSVKWEKKCTDIQNLESKAINEDQSHCTNNYIPRIEECDLFSIVYEPVHGIIYTNSQKEKRVMRPFQRYISFDDAKH